MYNYILRGKKYYKLFIIILGMGLLSACASASFSQDPSKRYQHYSAQELYMKGKQSLNSRNYKSAVREYEALESLYPFGGYAEKGQLDLIYAYFKTRDYASASAAADQYIRVYPRAVHVDYAYYMKGLSDYESSRTWVQRNLPIDMSERDLTLDKIAFYDFRQLIQLYPSSYYANDAQQRMVALRNMFAKHELHIAKYYYERGAYVAAANRATYIVDHFQKTPQIKPALVILVKSNRKLGLTQAANDANAILQVNFPGTKT